MKVKPNSLKNLQKGVKFPDQKNPNKKGRPPRLFTEFLDEAEADYPDPSADTVKRIVKKFLVYDDAKLNEIIADTRMSRVARRIATIIGSGNVRDFLQVLDICLDRGYGKALTTIEATLKEQPLFSGALGELAEENSPDEGD